MTLYQKPGISLQVNPTYREFRLWLFTPHSNLSLDLDAEKIRQVGKALGVARFLISNVMLHEVSWRWHRKAKFEVVYTRGERKYITEHVRDAFVRVRKPRKKI